MSTTASPTSHLMYSRDFILKYSHIKKEDALISEKIASLLAPAQSSKTNKKAHRTPFSGKKAWNPETTTTITTTDPRLVSFSEKKPPRSPRSPSHYPSVGLPPFFVPPPASSDPFTVFVPPPSSPRQQQQLQLPPSSSFVGTLSPTQLRSKTLFPLPDTQKENVPNSNLTQQQQPSKQLPKSPVKGPYATTAAPYNSGQHPLSPGKEWSSPLRKNVTQPPPISSATTDPLTAASVKSGTNGEGTTAHMSSTSISVVDDAVDHAPTSNPLTTPISSPIIKTPRARLTYQAKPHPSSTNGSSSVTHATDTTTLVDPSAAAPGTKHPTASATAVSTDAARDVGVPSVAPVLPDPQQQQQQNAPNYITPPSSPIRNLVSPTLEPRSPVPADYRPGSPYKSPRPLSSSSSSSSSSSFSSSSSSTIAVAAAPATAALVITAPATAAPATAAPATAAPATAPAAPVPSTASTYALSTIASAAPSASIVPAATASSSISAGLISYGSGGYVMVMNGTPFRSPLRSAPPLTSPLLLSPLSPKSPKSPRPISPLDEQRLMQRQKQIDYGYRTVGYIRYRLLVSKDQRRPDHPRTPKKTQACSKRSWDGQLKKWRRDLHLWDPDNMDVFRALLKSDLVVGIMAINPELDELVRIVLEKMDNPTSNNDEEEFFSPAKSTTTSSSSITAVSSTSITTTATTSDSAQLVSKLPAMEASEKKVTPSRLPTDGSLQKVARTLFF